MTSFSDDLPDETYDKLSIYQEINLEMFRREIAKAQAPELRKIVMDMSRLMLSKDNILKKILKNNY